MRNVICLEPIGYVEKGLPRRGEEPKPKSRFEVTSVIRLYEEYVDGLKGLEEYSHVIIVYFMHEAGEPVLTLKPWGDDSLPEVGIFATRFPRRPNPIGITVAKLVRVEPPRLLVRGFDGWTGSPILDVKPYDYYDIVKNPRVPRWFLDRWVEWRTAKKYEVVAPWIGPCECNS